MFCCGGLTIKYVRFLFPPPTLCLAYQLSISSDLLIPENMSALDPNLFISKLHHSIFVLSAKVNICVTIQNNPIPCSLLFAPTKRVLLYCLHAKQSYPLQYSNWTYQKSTGTVPKTKVLSRETSPRTTCIRKLTHVPCACCNCRTTHFSGQLL